MSAKTLKRLLDKRRTAALLEDFLQATPGLAACWLSDRYGCCFAGRAQGEQAIVKLLAERICLAGTVVIAPPYAGKPLFIDSEVIGIAIVREQEDKPAYDLAAVLDYLGIALNQAVELGRERREIIEDTLDKYREITLLYTIGETIGASLDIDQIARLSLATVTDIIKVQHSAVMLLNRHSGKLNIKAASAEAGFEQDMAVAQRVARNGRPEIINEAGNPARSLLCVPLKTRDITLGVIAVANKLSGEFSAADEKLLMTLATQAAVCIANADHYETIKRKNIAFERFVPTEFLRRLGKAEPEQVTLGEASAEELSVLFADIRAFTHLSEMLSAEKTFRFLNSYLAQIGPVIEQHGGFIDKYIGDAIMALFSGNRAGIAQDAVTAAVGIVETLQAFNAQRRKGGEAPVDVGIGVHTGPLMLGTIGFERRMESTVIGDTVNLASRVEGLTKRYGIPVGITSATLQKLTDLAAFLLREVDTVQVQGREHAVVIYEVFDADPPEIKEIKCRTLARYREALDLYRQRRWDMALRLFTELQVQLKTDRVVEVYSKRCHLFLEQPPAASWDGTTRLDEK